MFSRAASGVLRHFSRIGRYPSHCAGHQGHSLYPGSVRILVDRFISHAALRGKKIETDGKYWSSLIQNRKTPFNCSLLISVRTRTSFRVRFRPGRAGPKKFKTKQCAAKRFKQIGNSGLKYNHAGKAHLNTGKGRERINRLSKKAYLKGHMLKKMNLLILGKR